MWHYPSLSRPRKLFRFLRFVPMFFAFLLYFFILGDCTYFRRIFTPVYWMFWYYTQQQKKRLRTKCVGHSNGHHGKTQNTLWNDSCFDLSMFILILFYFLFIFVEKFVFGDEHCCGMCFDMAALTPTAVSWILKKNMETMSKRWRRKAKY